ncbi:MAG: hypothetical protein C5B52_09360 [Bacteroidetes bacterium]|nr:MAG: hypothetical protein C5B52_09360 [Bacteroidota bacterium]
MQQKPVSHYMCGAIIAAAMIIFSILVYVLGYFGNQMVGYLSYLILLIGIIVSVRLYGNSVDNSASFGKLFSFGFKTTALVIVIVLAFNFLFFIIFPEAKEKFFEISRQQMAEKGNTEEQIEQGIAMIQKGFWVFIILGTIFMCGIVGLVAAVIGAAITKKNPQSPFQQQA